MYLLTLVSDSTTLVTLGAANHLHDSWGGGVHAGRVMKGSAVSYTTFNGTTRSMTRGAGRRRTDAWRGGGGAGGGGRSERAAGRDTRGGRGLWFGEFLVP